MSAPPYLKFLRRGRRAPFSGAEWPPPQRGWVVADEPVGLCVSGVHACRVEHLAYWPSEELWLVELGDVAAEDHAKVLAGRGRLVERIEPWDVAAAVEAAEEFARRTKRQAAAVLRRDGLSDAADALEETTSPRAFGTLAADLRRRAVARRTVDCVRYARDAAELPGVVAEEARDDDVTVASARAVALASHVAGLTAAEASAEYDAERREHGLWLGRRLGVR